MGSMMAPARIRIGIDTGGTFADVVARDDLAAGSHELVITHGNGPQVGNLLVKNEIAASVVPSVPLYWCGAQTRATIGLLIMNALEAVLARRGLSRRVATLVTRTLVDADDPGSATRSNPSAVIFSRQRQAE
jgi:carbamate kinase